MKNKVIVKPLKISNSSIERLEDNLCLFFTKFSRSADLILKNKVLPQNVTYIFDNEPINKEIIKRMYGVIEKDYNVVIWP